MPSNAVKISQLVLLLEAIKDQHGDLDVVVPSQSAGVVYAVQPMSVEPQASLTWRSFIRPVLAIQPTDTYEATPESAGNGWSYDLGLAPEGVTVQIMKRRGGEDTGQRQGDMWSAFEGGARAWELAPGGVLAWRAIP